MAYPVHPIISGPSNEKGSDSSGSDLILYVFVTNSFEKKSFGSNLNSRVKLYIKKKSGEIKIKTEKYYFVLKSESAFLHTAAFALRVFALKHTDKVKSMLNATE